MDDAARELDQPLIQPEPRGTLLTGLGLNNTYLPPSMASQKALTAAQIKCVYENLPTNGRCSRDVAPLNEEAWHYLMKGAPGAAVLEEVRKCFAEPELLRTKMSGVPIRKINDSFEHL